MHCSLPLTNSGQILNQSNWSEISLVSRLRKSHCVCVRAGVSVCGKWEEIGGLKWRKRRRASSVGVFQIEIFDFSPEKRAAWLLSMPFFVWLFGKKYNCHSHWVPWVWAFLSFSKQNAENGEVEKPYWKISCWFNLIEFIPPLQGTSQKSGIHGMVRKG